MLRLDRLELSGFKSFVDPVTLDFSGGITGIVGPNGCGKSNISDAMTWVLGEQSAKTLRGESMEDVIFNGSESRKPLGMCEVTLRLQTDPSFAGSDHGSVAISRRVFRSGESQYRLNGKVVRLKEIRDLLMDTGLGLRAYAVIEQGKIGTILSGKPQERRKLIEEAAGITRYKARKRLAEVKLEEARANLLRLDDIVAEVDRNLKALKRQAAAAKRYQAKQEEYRELLETVLLERARGLWARRTELAARLEATVTRDAELTAALTQGEAALAQGREELDELARRVAARHKQSAELAATIEGRQEFLKGARQRVEEINERFAAGEGQAKRRQSETVQLELFLEDLDERRDSLERERSQAAEAVSRDESAIQAAEREVSQSEARAANFEREVAAALAGLEGARAKHHQSELERERVLARAHHLETAAAEHGHEAAQAGEALVLAEGRVRALETDITTGQGAAARLAADLDAVLRLEAQANELVRSLETQLATTRQRQKFLDELARAHAERRTGLAAALTAAGLTNPSYLADHVRALEGWERSLDAYLGDLADAVVLPAGGAREVAASLQGRAAARLLSPLPVEPIPSVEVDDPAVVLRLGEALGLAPELAAGLPPAFLVATEEDAERLAQSHRTAAFLSPGGLWFHGGMVTVEGKRAEPGVLERERELKRLGRELPRLEQRLTEAVASLAQRVEERAETARQRAAAEAAVAALQQELAVARARHEDAAVRRRRLAASGEELARERATVDTELAALAERRAALAAAIEKGEAQLAAARGAAQRSAAELEAARERRERCRESSADQRGRLELLSERLESHDREMGRVRRQIAEGRQQFASWEEEAQVLASRRESLTAQMTSAEIELQGALERRAVADEDTLAEQHRLDVRRASQRTQEEQTAARREERDAVRSELESLRVQEASLGGDASHLTATYRAEIGRELPVVFPAAPAGVSQRELEARLAHTKETLERLGPVNLLAVEEHDEQEERLGFLTTQRADVATSVDSLRATIREINQASSERFLATFAEVNVAFGEIFAKLFRGGEAEMRLMDDEDVLECGIEIVARPPGKRLQNLMLMSGGEKALTAVALLFALFRTKPSPFCILDEVDAPLDDANTVRFAEMLKEMCADTQFLVITHNKITMEAASSLYGVTMEERGVSKLVAVELDEVQPLPTAASA